MRPMPVASVALGLLLAGCIETGIDGITRDEACNGRDDDGDGQVDEGFSDGDGDGIADCIDLGCALELHEGGTVEADPTCTASGVPIEDPWPVRIEWQVLGPSMGVAMTPVIGNLTDDDGDGDVDEDDIPDIVVVTFDDDIWNGRLRVLSGDGSGMHWELEGWNGLGGIALADLDGDGVLDVTGFDGETRHPIAVRSDGTPLWRADQPVGPRHPRYPQATVADIDGDGSPEVIADTQVLDGRTGALKLDLPIDSLIRSRIPAAADLDLDGRQEILIGHRAYSASGQELWSSPIRGSRGHWAAVLNADGDPEAEIAMIGGARYVLHEHDGTVIHDRTAGASGPGPPCVADFDGDGAAEIAWVASSVLYMYELDGSKSWDRPVFDENGAASCSGFDLDGDGAYEVLYADQRQFFAFDGATGEIRTAVWGHGSHTIFEYPSVADVDNDGSAEIVFVSSGVGVGWQGITVLGHDGAGWMKSGSTWHIHDFAVTSFLPDSGVPARPEPWWLEHNVYRARPAIDERAATDLRVQATDLCVSSCRAGGLARLAIQIGNLGLDGSGPRIPYEIRRVDGDTETRIHTGWVQRAVEAGEVLPSTVVELPVEDILGADALLVEVDGEGWGRHVECAEDNNTHLWVEMPCR